MIVLYPNPNSGKVIAGNRGMKECKRAEVSLTKRAEFLKKASSYLVKGRVGPAKLICEKILAGALNDEAALMMLSALYLFEKKYEKSRVLLNRLLAIDPRNTDGLNYLGLICLEYDRNLPNAISFFKKALETNPSHLNALTNLGNTHLAMGEIDLAESYFLRAHEINPKDGVVLNNLGVLSVRKNDRAKSIDYYQQALRHLPHDREILANLMISYNASGNRMGAKKLALKVAKMKDAGIALFPALNTIKMCCFWPETESVLEKVFTEIRENRALLSGFENINLLILTISGIKHQTLLETLKKSGDLINRLRTRPPFERHENAMKPTRRWRIGYLSPDFRSHVVNTFFRGLINNYDKDHFEVFCYSNTKKEDHITAQYRNTADVFIDVTGLSDAKLAEKIHSDGIHFLVDLAGFTQGGRLPVLSYRPAPVQLMYLGYPYTSGLDAVDYFISDRFVDGPDNAKFFTEKQLRLPESFVCHGLLEEQEITEGIPWEKNGYITFGSLINTYKLNPEVIKVWSQILKDSPTSKLILNHPNYDLKAVRTNIFREFSKQGIRNDRVSISWAKHPGGNFLRHYNDLDIVLDSFPATGGTTTHDALWMGLPVMTLVGDIYPERLSYSILSNLGLEVSDLISFSETEYIEKAVRLAADPERVAELHRAIPPKLKQSIFCDPARFTRQVESALIEGWKRKYDHCPVSEASPEGVEYVPISHGLEVAVNGFPSDLNTYILKEHQGWFDPEYFFVEKLLKPGMSVLDLFDENGSYSILLANRIGVDGVLWVATRTRTAGFFLEKSMKRNGLNNMTLIGQGEKALGLDQEAKTHAFEGVDFVRLNVNAAEMDLLKTGESFFGDNTPVVMFSIRRDNAVVDTCFVSWFKARGYDIFRLIPGLSVLVPFLSDGDLDIFALNLFAVKKKQAVELTEQGLLIVSMELALELPGLEVGDWQAYLARYPYAKTYMSDWLLSMKNESDWDVYWMALNLFSWSKEITKPAALRYAALQRAYGLLCMLVKNKGTLPRLLSLCRVMIEMGKREELVSLIEHVLSLFEGGQGLNLGEAFLPLSEADALVDPGEHSPEWLFASVLKQREKNRVFSSFFLGSDVISVYEIIQKTGFGGSETERQLQLLSDRYLEQDQKLEALDHERSIC